MVLIPRGGAAALTAVPVVRRWAVASGSIALVAVALCGLFPRAAVGAYQVWVDSTAYNHCFLILPVAVYLAWQRRDALARVTPVPTLWPLVLLVPLTLLWLLTAQIGILEAQQFVVVAMFQVVALAVLGVVAYRALLAPLLYLFFLVPAGYFLVPWLQDFTARFMIAGLHLLHIPVYSDGTLIEIPAGKFVVAEACAGLRFLIASIAFGVLFATLMYRSRIRWLAFILLSIVVPIIANGLRGLGLLVLAEASGSATAVMADHLIYGWLFFAFVTLVLIVVGMTFSDMSGPPSIPALRPIGLSEGAPWRIGAVAVLSLGLVAVGPAYARLSEWRATPMRLDQAAPAMAPSWTPDPTAASVWKPVVFHPDLEFHDAFANDGGSVIRYVALYAAAGLDDNLARGQNEIADPDLWTLLGRGSAAATLDGRKVTVATTEIKYMTHRLLVWHFFAVGDRIVASPMQAKLARLRGLLGGGRPVAAFVAVAAEDGDPTHPAAAQLQGFLADMAPLGPYLQAVPAR